MTKFLGMCFGVFYNLGAKVEKKVYPANKSRIAITFRGLTAGRNWKLGIGNEVLEMRHWS